MGFSFSGLSLVTAAAAEPGTGDVVKDGAGSGHQGPKPFLSTGEAAREEEGSSTDSDSGWPLPALCACADGRPSQLQGAPSQVSLFSSMWTAALGISEPESSSAGHDSFSILASEELLSARGASQERSAPVFAANGEAVAAAAGDLMAARLHLGSRLSGSAVNPDHLALLRDAGLLRLSPAPVSPTATAVAETATKAADATSEAMAVNRDGLARNVAAMVPGAEVDGPPASVTAHQNLDPSSAGPTHPLQTLPQNAVSRLLGSLPDGAAADRADDQLGPVFGSKASRPESSRIALAAETADPTRPIPANNIADPFAAVAVIAKSTTPNLATSGAAPQPAASHTDTFQTMLHGVSGTVSDTPATGATSLTPQKSEIAFQAEIQLNNGPSASDAAVSNPQRDALARWTANVPREEVSVNGAANGTQQGESKRPAESAETLQPIAFRRTGDHSDAGGSCLGQDHASGNLDRGTQQTTPLSHGPSVMAPKPAAEGTLSSRPSTTPAAAQLDSAAPATPPETGQAARSINLKIQSDDGAANVVLTDRGGQVHVTVRSSDPALTQSLRSDLGSLTGGLQQNGFDVKLWSPSPGSSADSGERGNSSEQSGQDDLRGQTRHRHSPDDAEQRNRRQSEWHEEFD